MAAIDGAPGAEPLPREAEQAQLVARLPTLVDSGRGLPSALDMAARGAT
jgi:hypothetical protein